MAEIDKSVQQYNIEKVAFDKWLQFCSENEVEPHLFIPIAEAFLDIIKERRDTILENLLASKGLEVCHFSDIHYHRQIPEKWELSDMDWRMGLFPKSAEKLFFRADLKRNFGGNTPLEVVNPELIVLCPEHFPKYSVGTSTIQTKDGWLTNVQSGVTMINRVLHPTAELGIEITQPAIRKRPDSIYRYYGFVK